MHFSFNRGVNQMRKRKTIRRGFALFVSLVMLFGMTFSGVPTFAGEAEVGSVESAQDAGFDGVSVADPTDNVDPVIDENPGESVVDENPGESVVDENPGESVVDENPGKSVVDENPGKSVVDENPGESVVDENPGKSVVDENPGTKSTPAKDFFRNGSGDFSLGIKSVIVPPEPELKDTYNFYNNEDVLVRSQTVIEGDTLFQPDNSLAGGNEATFLGWYVGDDKLEFGEDGKLTITSVTGETITVKPKFATIYYVTFYDENNLTVLSRRPVQLAEGATTGTLHFADLTVTSSNPNKEFEYWADAPQTEQNPQGGNKVDSPVTVDGDMKLYPVFSEGHWITFNVNRTPAMEGVSVDYVCPQYVKGGESAIKPSDPQSGSPAFTFAGWYKESGCQNAFDWDSVITENLTLYAKWNQDQVPFRIIVWTQNVNDSKNATPEQKTYAPFKVYTHEAGIGTTVQLSGNAQNGFYYDGLPIEKPTPTAVFAYNSSKSNLSATVANDGSTTLNVYYDRQLLTIDFHSNGFSGVEDGEFTGLYGQTLVQNGYTWPAYNGCCWAHHSSSTWNLQTLTFLDAFIFDQLPSQFGSLTKIDVYCRNDTANKSIRFYKQNVDGSTYPYDPTNTIMSSGTSFNITNKYNGFEAAQYRRKSSRTGNWGNWQTTTAGTSVSMTNYSALEIRFTRNSYNLRFYDGPFLQRVETKFYEASLNDLSSYGLSPNPAEKTFGGWALVDGVSDPGQAIDLSTMTMPANGLDLYAIWVPVKYRVEIYVNGGELNPEQVTEFELGHGDNIDGTYLNAATKAGYNLIGWFTQNGLAWNFSNGLDADLCDEGPLYEDPEHKHVYYKLYLKAKWRRSGTISVVYELAGGSGDFQDNNNYIQDASAQILPTSPTAPSGKFFAGWLDAQGNLHQPGQAIVLSEDLIVEENGNAIVKLIAQYTTEVPKATITYHANYADANPSNIVKPDEGYYAWNDEVELLGESAFSRAGYKLIGWNKDQEAASIGEVEFACGASALVSAMGTNLVDNVGNNDLYGVWKPVLTVTSGSKSWTYDGNSHTFQQYNLVYGDQTFTGEEGDKSFLLNDGTKVTITPTMKGDVGVKDVADSTIKNNTFTVSTDDPEVSQGEHVAGTLTINPKAVTIKAQDKAFTYTGEAQS